MTSPIVSPPWIPPHRAMPSHLPPYKTHTPRRAESFKHIYQFKLPKSKKKPNHHQSPQFRPPRNTNKKTPLPVLATGGGRMLRSTLACEVWPPNLLGPALECRYVDGYACERIRLVEDGSCLVRPLAVIGDGRWALYTEFARRVSWSGGFFFFFFFVFFPVFGMGYLEYLQPAAFCDYLWGQGWMDGLVSVVLIISLCSSHHHHHLQHWHTPYERPFLENRRQSIWSENTGQKKRKRKKAKSPHILPPRKKDQSKDAGPHRWN